MNNKNSSFDYNKLTSYYPYGELPLKYTKQGQAQLKKELENNSSSAFFNEPDKFYNGNIKTKNNNNSSNKESNSNESAIDDKPKNSNNDTFDFKTILPLLSNFGADNKLKDLIPLISKGGNLGMNDLLKLFSNINKPKVSSSTIELDDSTYIDNLKKVE